MELYSCHVEAECNNTIGSYDCICNEGFEGDGFNCTSKLLELFYSAAYVEMSLVLATVFL